jgi:hypothetical protein
MDMGPTCQPQLPLLPICSSSSSSHHLRPDPPSSLLNSRAPLLRPNANYRCLASEPFCSTPFSLCGNLPPLASCMSRAARCQLSPSERASSTLSSTASGHRSSCGRGLIGSMPVAMEVRPWSGILLVGAPRTRAGAVRKCPASLASAPVRPPTVGVAPCATWPLG